MATLLLWLFASLSQNESQTLAALRYHQVVSRKSDRQVFHNETGYWMWDRAAGIVMQSLTIPRAVCVLAGGNAKAQDTTVEVRAGLGDKDWGILQSPFMRDKARTTGFTHKVSIEGNQMSYSETTKLEIYGKTPQSVEDYPNSQVIYLISRDDQESVKRYTVWEIDSFKPFEVTNTWEIQNAIGSGT